jgi:hypothetical protein
MSYDVAPFYGSYATLLILNRSSTVENVSTSFGSSSAFSVSPDLFHESAKLILVAKSKGGLDLIG